MELTAVAVKRVLGLRDREVALSDAVLTVIELADGATGSLDRSAVGGQGKFAVCNQQKVTVTGSGVDVPQRLAWDASLGHGGQGDETESCLHFAAVECGWSGLVGGGWDN